MITTIRFERSGDEETISLITCEAFRTHIHSNHTEHVIIENLRQAKILSISLVAEVADRIIGHIAFSPVSISDGSPDWYGLGPLSVLPSHQRQGIGQALVRQGLLHLSELSARGCVVFGAPSFYGRFGFAHTSELVFPGASQEFFLCLSLSTENAQGEVAYHAAFNTKPSL
jgi:putative acetyltransferase